MFIVLRKALIMTLERTAPPVGDALIAALAHHLRLPESFGPDPERDAALREALGAAIEAVEARTARTLAPRRLTARTRRWRADGRFLFPTGPVRTLVSLIVVDGGGSPVPADVAGLRLEPDLPPALAGALPSIPCGGFAEVVFEAGYGAGWEDAPGDLRQAAILLAGAIHEGRPGAAASAVAALTAPYRPVRL